MFALARKFLLAASSLLVAAFVFHAAPSYASIVTVSTFDSEFSPGTLNQGWRSDNPAITPAWFNDNHLSGTYDGNTYRSFYTFNLSGIDDTITQATLRIMRGIQSGPLTLSFWDVTSPAYDVNNYRSTYNPSIFNDLGSGISYGGASVGNGDSGDYLSFTLNANALAALNAASGYLTIGITVDTPNAYLFAGTGHDRSYLDLAVGNNVPEPATLLLFGAALLAAGAVRKKKAQ
jgi:hypothetical protein